jgi:RNA polymerase sigma-70 factor, ECF subfamily
VADIPLKHARSRLSGPEATLSTTLLDRVKAGQPAAWERLFALYSPLVYGWCRRCDLQAAEAADIAQEVFATVNLRVPDFSRHQGQGTFRGWLRAITRNKIGDFLRRQRRPEHAQGGTQARERIEGIPDPLESTSADDDAQEERTLVSRAMELVRAEFEPRTWQAFWQVTADGRTSAEVAVELGMTLQAVYKAKSRVLCRLREELVDG